MFFSYLDKTTLILSVPEVLVLYVKQPYCEINIYIFACVLAFFSCKDAAQQVHLCLSLSVCLWSPLPDMTADDSLTPDDSLLMVGQIAGDS